MNEYSLNVNCKTKSFNNYWQLCVGSGHAGLGLRKDWQEQLKYLHDELGFKYVRFHGLFCEDMKVAATLNEMIPLSAAKEVVTYSFYQIACLFDYILSIGMKPFVEIGFMPRALASGKKTIFFYKANITPPKDYDKWNDFIYKFIDFLIDRYTLEEVESWYFEVWNEPDLRVFWSGDKKEYFKLYKNTANTIKKLSKNIRVGGPSTSGGNWIGEFKEYCEKENIPLDFISTHEYPGDALGHDVGGDNPVKQVISYIKKVKDNKGKDIHTFFSNIFKQAEVLKRTKAGSLTRKAVKARKTVGDFPLIYTEWNSNSQCTSYLNDDLYTSSLIVKTIVDNNGIVDGYSFWTFSDIFEELSFFHKPFSGSFGMLNIHGIPKPSFWAFKLISKLGDRQFDVKTSTQSETLEIAAFIKDNCYQLLLYNHQMPEQKIDDEKIKIVLDDIKIVKSVIIETIDEINGNSKRVWDEMGQPEYLKPIEVEYIKEKSKVVQKDMDYLYRNEQLTLEVTMMKQQVSLIEINV